MEQKMLKISKKLGIKPWWNPERPEEMYYKLRVFANLEAKYSLLTLLSRPKAATNNLMGGMTFTGISAGFHPLMTAMSLKKVRETIPGGKDFHGWSDVFDWANVSGATESWLISMIGHTPLFKTGKWARFGERALTVIKKDPMVSDRTIRDIAREEGLSDALVQKGASFMLFAERRLRTISFVAHYIKGMGDLYGDKGRFKRDDPWLVNYALRGVEASQFLYNNAKRPIFGAVTIGRTYARFQLWGWNAIKNKKDIAKAANSYGFRPGTDEYVKFKRMITTDMFVMALGTLFTASLFESTMPPPYSFLQDFASLLFGDKKERDKAFFGTLPAPFSAIQMISPPSARLLLQPLGNLMKGDWERFTDYQVWSWAPFGLLSRDVIRTVENPTMGIENMTGIPVHGFHRYLRKEREKISTSPHLFYNSDKEESQQ
jgi:hypothetical protein